MVRVLWLVVSVLVVWGAGAQTTSPTVQAVVGIEQMVGARLAVDRPGDFDAFWDGRLAALRAAEMKVEVRGGESGDAGVVYEKVDVSVSRKALGAGDLNVRMQLARPAGEGKFPGVIVVQWAGVYGLQKGWVTGRAKEGWLALNVMPHDLPIDETEAFYKAQGEGPLKGYTMIGNTARETSYMTDILDRCVVAARYFKTRSEWDGRVLVVTGGSQGGWQAIALAALDKSVTGVMVNVPAGCDTQGYEAGRATGWPYWWGNAKGKADEVAIMETSRYSDAVNFAQRVKCPVLVGVGLVDKTCPPLGVAVMFHSLASKDKELVLMPGAGHKSDNGAHDAYRAAERLWGERLKRGQ